MAEDFARYLKEFKGMPEDFARYFKELTIYFAS